MRAIIEWLDGSTLTIEDANGLTPPSQALHAFMLMKQEKVMYINPAAVKSITTEYPGEGGVSWHEGSKSSSQ